MRAGPHPNLATALAVLAVLFVGMPIVPALWPRHVCGALAVLLLVALIVLPVLRRVTNGGPASTPARRFDAGLCVRCGYDLRGGSTICPECGRPAATIEGPLLAPTTPNAFSGNAPEVDEALVILQRRPPTPGQIWPDPAHAAVAALIAYRCHVTGGWPNDHFRPADAFALMIDDWEGAVLMDLSFHLREELGIDVTAADLHGLRDRTFGDVVARLAARNALAQSTDGGSDGRDDPH